MSGSSDPSKEQRGSAETPSDETPLVEMVIDGVLDLHTFNPKDLKALLHAYVGACREKGILELRIIHGKGSGTLRETVHGLLTRMPEVEAFRLAPEDAGGWGATLVMIKPLAP